MGKPFLALQQLSRQAPLRPSAAGVTGSRISWCRWAHPAEPEQLLGVQVGGEGTGGRDMATVPGEMGPTCSLDSCGGAGSFWDGSRKAMPHAKMESQEYFSS